MADETTVVDSLNQLLANTFTLYLKTHNFHWNITGAYFVQLHELFDRQYNELWESVDKIAERIRSLKGRPLATLTSIYEKSAVEEPEDVPSWQEMVKQLTIDREKASLECQELFRLATKAKDDTTANYALELSFTHDKAAWMLRSIIQN